MTKASLWPDRHVLGIVLLAAALLVGGARAGGDALARPRVCWCWPRRGAAARGRRGRIWLAAPLPARALPVQPRGLLPSHVWAFFRGVHHARVGVVGTFGGFFSYPLWGPDDSNHVQYVGARGPHGSFDAIATCRQWREALNNGRYQYVVTTPARDPWHPKRWPLARIRLDPLGSSGQAGAQPPGQGSADRRVPDPGPDAPGLRARTSPQSRSRRTLSSVSDVRNRRSTRRSRAARDRLGPRPARRRRQARPGSTASSTRRSPPPRRSPTATPARSPSSTPPGSRGRCTSSSGSTTSSDARAPTPPCASPPTPPTRARGALLQRVQERGTELETKLLFFDLEWAALDDARADELLASSRLRAPTSSSSAVTTCGRVRRYRPHLLSENEEKLLAEKSISSQQRLGPTVRRAGSRRSGSTSTATR